MLNSVPVVDSRGETPGPIPNPEVKPTHADGTAPDREWESRTPPDFNLKPRNRFSAVPGFFVVPSRVVDHPAFPAGGRHAWVRLGVYWGAVDMKRPTESRPRCM